MFGIPFLTPTLAIKAGCIVAIIGALWFAEHEVVKSIQTKAVAGITAQVATHEAQQTAAVQTAVAHIATTDAQIASADVTAQAAITQVATTNKQKVKSHVHEPAPSAPRVIGCVTYGLLRAHDAAALGLDVDALPLPTGATDDTCSPVTNSDLALAIQDNYAAALANAKELTDIQAAVHARVDETPPPSRMEVPRMLLFTVEHHHYNHNIEGELALAQVSAAFQAQLDRLGALVTELKAAPGTEQDATDTSALSSALDSAGAPPVPVVDPAQAPA